MIVLGLILLAAAVWGAAVRFVPKAQAKAMDRQKEWADLMNKGLAHEFLFIDAGSISKWAKWVIAAAFAVSLFTLNVIPLAVTVALAWGAPQLALKLIRDRRRRLFAKQFAGMLPQVTSILRAGHTLERALHSVVETHPNPLAQEFGLVLKEVGLGASLDEALEHLLQRFPSRELDILIQAISISRKVGSNLAEVFHKVSDMIQVRTSLKDRLQSMTAQGRMQAWIAVAMPVSLVLTLRFIAPEYLDPLFESSTGHLILCVSAVMVAAGGVWIHKICTMELMR